MAPLEELERLLADPESDRVERKESAGDPDRLRQAVCAFANDLPGHGRPGYLFIGVSDDGRPRGLPVTDQLLRTLADMRSDGNTLPIPSLTVQRIDITGVPVAVVEVQPSSARPVRFKGRTWIRVGPRREIATLEEERRLTERHTAGMRTFDQRPCLDATMSDLALDSFRSIYLPRVVAPEVIAENRRSIEEQLASLRFFDTRTGNPTYAGALVFGRDPEWFLPGAYVQFVRFNGETLADPILDSRKLGGNLLTQLQQLDNLLPVQIRSPRVPASTLRNEDQPDYPRSAVREFVLNAIMHRTYEQATAPVKLYWYSEHIEIQNPGSLYGEVTAQNIGRVTAYRNPVLAEAIRALGYVEKFGVGINQAQAALEANGSPPAEFTFEPSNTLVRIRRRT